MQAVKNKAQCNVFEGLKQIRSRLPFLLLGIDSDNGSEFINGHLQHYCEDEHITFTRSRPYRKNDNCYVEQKNYSVVPRRGHFVAPLRRLLPLRQATATGAPASALPSLEALHQLLPAGHEAQGEAQTRKQSHPAL